MFRLLPWALLVVALLPSAWFAFAARELPHLGAHGDGGHYYVAALALAEGRGYRAASVPGEPRLTRFPPGLPALVAPFVPNRAVLSLLLWLLAPCSLALVFFWGRQQGLAHPAAAWVCLPLGAFPAFVQASADVRPDLLSLALVLATVYVVEQNSRGAAVLGALAAAAAYLTNDALLPGLCAVGLYLAFRRRFLQAGLFGLVLLSVALGWQSYVRANADPAAGDLLRWYLGGPPSFRLSQFALDVRMAILVAVAAGAWWITRSRELSAYSCFAVVAAAALLFAEPGQSILPLLPLPLVALATFPFHQWVLAAGALAALPSLAAAGTDLQRYRNLYPLRSQAYFWIETHTPASARFLATNDALLYAVTGRHGFSPRNLPAPTSLARNAGLDYLLATPADPAGYQAAVEADPFYVTVYEHEGVLIRRLR